MRSFCHKTTHLFYVCSLRAKLGHSVLKHEPKALSFIFVVFCDDHLYFVMMARVRVWIKVRSVSKSMKTSSLMLGSWEQKWLGNIPRNTERERLSNESVKHSGIMNYGMFRPRSHSKAGSSKWVAILLVFYFPSLLSLFANFVLLLRNWF